MLLEEKKTISEVSEFSILPYTQNQKLGNLGKCSFTSNFDSCYNLRFRQKLKIVKWIKKKKRKLRGFQVFDFVLYPKVILLQIFTEIVKHCFFVTFNITSHLS